MKICSRLLMIATALFFSMSVFAFDGITYYSTTISNNDRYNSSGVRLTSVRAILRQDRANMHKFGRADNGDGYDTYFKKASHRNMFNHARLSISRSLARAIKGSGRVRITVFVFPGKIEVVR